MSKFIIYPGEISDKCNIYDIYGSVFAMLTVYIHTHITIYVFNIFFIRLVIKISKSATALTRHNTHSSLSM